MGFIDRRTEAVSLTEPREHMAQEPRGAALVRRGLDAVAYCIGRAQSDA